MLRSFATELAEKRFPVWFSFVRSHTGGRWSSVVAGMTESDQEDQEECLHGVWVSELLKGDEPRGILNFTALGSPPDQDSAGQREVSPSIECMFMGDQPSLVARSVPDGAVTTNMTLLNSMFGTMRECFAKEARRYMQEGALWLNFNDVGLLGRPRREYVKAFHATMQDVFEWTL